MKAEPALWLLLVSTLALGAGCGGDATLAFPSGSTGSTGTGGAGTGGAGGEDATTSISTSSAATSSGAGGAGGDPSSTSSTSSASSASSTTSSTTSSSASTGSGGADPNGCFTDVSAGHHLFACDGNIKYDVEIPAACAAGGCGLIVDIHGFTMTAESEDKGTQMRALGKQHGYVVVQPTAPGLPSSWNQGMHAPLVFAFIEETAAALAIDPKRVHVMGFSQGGGMTWRLLCQHADYFASASPLGALAGCEFSGANVPSAEVPVLVVHGRKDNVVNFNGVAVPQRDKALKYWSYGAGAMIEEDAAHKATKYLSPNGTVLAFWEHDYQAGSFILGGHCFPGGPDKGLSPLQFGCNDANTFVYGELAMSFFLAHPKP